MNILIVETLRSQKSQTVKILFFCMLGEVTHICCYAETNAPSPPPPLNIYGGDFRIRHGTYRLSKSSLSSSELIFQWLLDTYIFNFHYLIIYIKTFCRSVYLFIYYREIQQLFYEFKVMLFH